jgi:ketosteroid isomerase-like protein
MAHPVEQVIRDAYAAFGRGDLEGYLRTCSENWSFTVPGATAIAGTYHGAQGLLELAQKVMGLTGGTFQEELEDVLANDRHGVVLARHWFTRDGRRHEYRVVHVYQIVGGKLGACRELTHDQAGFDAAWAEGAAAVGQ